MYFQGGDLCKIFAAVEGMKVQSFISEKGQLVPVEVELTLWPGLPGIQFLGLPDQHLKESALRIKSAIRQQGFEFPKARQILVNLRPSYLKKNSRGIELAVAAAYLWETKQLPRPLRDQNFFVYGELNLSGEVFEPEDLLPQPTLRDRVILTGASSLECSKPFRRQVVKTLQEIRTPRELLAVSETLKIERPQLPKNFLLSREQADVLEVTAVGGHSVLMAGPAGSGKTTLAKALHQLLPLPTPAEWQEIVDTQQKFGSPSAWRPLIKPHHTTPKISMIGGGSVPMAGEISRAHGGVLLLDEFLEFPTAVQEALREPFEERLIRVARSGKVQIFPAGGLIVGTTNLCPCGDKVPGATEVRSCRFSRLRCHSYSQRLSGPLLDRFELLVFLGRLERPTIPWELVRDNIDRAVAFKADRSGCTAKAAAEESVEPLVETQLAQMRGSERRRLATLRVARTIADLRGSSSISLHDFDRASNWTLRTFDKMSRWDLEVGCTL